MPSFINKIVILVTLGVILACTFCGCKEDRPEQSNLREELPTERTDSSYVLLLDRLLFFQNKITADVSDAHAVIAYRKISYDTATDCFYTVGKGVANKNFPEAAQNASRQLAAKRTAINWVLYLKNWSEGKSIEYGTPVSGNIMYSKSVLDQQEGDTLLRLFQFPIGSIILE